MEDVKDAKYTIWNSTKSSLKEIWKYQKIYFGVNCISIIIQGIIPAVLIRTFQVSINMLQSGTYLFRDVLNSLLIYCGLNIINALVMAYVSLYNNQFISKFNKHISTKMLNKATQLKLSDYENSETYNIITRAQSQNGVSIHTYLYQILDVLKQIITIFSTTVILVGFQKWIIGVVLVVPVLKSLITIILNKQWYRMKISRTSEERKAWYINFLIMTGNSFKEIKIYGIKKYLIKKFDKIQNEIIVQDVRIYKKSSIIVSLLEVFDWTINGCLFAYIFWQGFGGIILLGDVTAYSNSIFNIKNSIQSIFANIESILEQSLYLDLLFRFFDIPTENKENDISISDINKIELKNLSFKYYDGQYVLKNINMTISTNDKIAFVGKNGSGKTTLIKLILGLYDEYEGDIYINNINLKEINISNYHKQIGCIFQDYVKYESSIRENIAFGDIENIENDQKLWEVIQSINLDSRIYKPEGLETIVGNWFGKKQLSLGEWQKIAVARALFKKADLYIFDEPDASLDITKQRELISVYSKMLENKIGIYVSHRINYVPYMASYIYVLDEGEIFEAGTHDELMEMRGLYFKMYQECEEIDDSKSMKKGR